MWLKGEEGEEVAGGEAEVDPGAAVAVVVVHLVAEVVAVEVADAEVTREVAVVEEGEAGEVEVEEGACKRIPKLLGYHNPCAILFRNFVVVKINVKLN